MKIKAQKTWFGRVSVELLSEEKLPGFNLKLPARFIELYRNNRPDKDRSGFIGTTATDISYKKILLGREYYNSFLSGVCFGFIADVKQATMPNGNMIFGYFELYNIQMIYKLR